MFAHVVGGDALPAPPWLLSYIGIALVLGTAAALRATWPAPRHAASEPAIPAERPSVGPGNIVGLVLYGLLVAIALGGPDSTASNVAYWLTLVVFWVGLPILCLLLGDVMRAVNPFLPVVALFDRRRAEDPDRAVPTWTAAAFLALWVWYLLAYYQPNQPRVVGALLIAYAIAAVGGGVWWGRRWLHTGEAFGAISAAVARIGVRAGGRRWAAAVPGTAVVMIVWIGSTAFDGFTYRPFWQDVLGTNREWTRTMLNTVGFLWITAIVAGAYLLVVRVAERGQAEPDRARRLTEAFGPALVPLAVGWFLGHDLTLLITEGQNAYALISDPFGRGWDLFGTYNHTIDYSILEAWWVPWVQMVLIAAGHVASVVVLHELAMQRLSPRAAMRTTWAMAGVCSASVTAACMLVLT